MAVVDRLDLHDPVLLEGLIMGWSRLCLVVAGLWCVGSCIATSASAADSPEILSVRKIWDQGQHNAFTDLIRWHDTWYCCFREADAHVGGDGKLRVLESLDGQQWEPVGLIAETGIDLRDPKLSVTPDGRLMAS